MPLSLFSLENYQLDFKTHFDKLHTLHLVMFILYLYKYYIYIYTLNCPLISSQIQQATSEKTRQVFMPPSLKCAQ